MKLLFKIINRISPSLGNLIVQVYYTLNGWRFDDLKQHFSKSNNSTDEFVLISDALERVRSTPATNQFAFVSPMPPAATGVGTCNLKTLLAADFQCDIYSEWDSISAYCQFEQSVPPTLTGYPYTLFPLLSLRRKYKKVVASVGNSDHNIFVIATLLKENPAQRTYELSLHLHDPCLWNLAIKSLCLEKIDLMQAIITAYPHKNALDIENLFSHSAANWQIIEGLVGLGLYGTKLIIDRLKPTEIIMNSEKGISMILEEFNSIPSYPIKLGYHPIFLTDRRQLSKEQSHDGEIRIGCFGIPGTNKGTQLIVDTYRELLSRKANVKLVMAGFAVDQYLRSNIPGAANLNIETHSNVDETTLLEIMDSVDVAVQLRTTNLGESSGIIASLIAKRCPVVATNIGSFSEYKSCIIPVPIDIGAKDLATIIVNSALQNEALFSAMEEFEAKHPPEKLALMWFTPHSPAANSAFLEVVGEKVSR